MTGLRISTLARHSRLAELAAAGKTAKEIAAAESICLATVYQWARGAGIKLERVGQDQKEVKTRILQLAVAGKSTDEIALELRVRPHAVYRLARAAGISLKRSFKTKTDPVREARRAKMAEMYRQGVTLAKIGEQFGMTRERVRQILGSLGLNGANGGAHVVAKVRRASRDNDLEAKCLAKYGLPVAVVRQLRKDRVTHAFQAQRQSAFNRGIAWDLSFAQWFAVWQASGKLHLRGRGRGKYVMSRMSDAGGYELGNVHIQLATENSKDAVSKWKGKTKANRGVFCLYPGRELAWLAKYGKKSLGFFKTEAEAVAARSAYLEANPQKREAVRGRGYTAVKGKGGRAGRFQVMVGKKYVGSYLTPDEALAARAAYLASQAAAQPAEATAQA